jgi:hypothetical protein
MTKLHGEDRRQDLRTAKLCCECVLDLMVHSPWVRTSKFHQPALRQHEAISIGMGCNMRSLLPRCKK